MGIYFFNTRCPIPNKKYGNTYEISINRNEDTDGDDAPIEINKVLNKLLHDLDKNRGKFDTIVILSKAKNSSFLQYIQGEPLTKDEDELVDFVNEVKEVSSNAPIVIETHHSEAYCKSVFPKLSELVAYETIEV